MSQPASPIAENPDLRLIARRARAWMGETWRIARHEIPLMIAARTTKVAKKDRLFRQRRRFNRAEIILVSKPGSGRTWLRVLLSRLYQSKYGLPQLEIVRYDNLHRRNTAIPRIVFSHGKDYPMNLLPEAEAVRKYGRKKVILLVRNPLDSMVTVHFHVTKRPGASQRRKPHGLAKLPLYEAALVRLPAIIDFLNAWQARAARLGDRFLLVRYEDLRTHPESVLQKISDFLGADFTPEQIREAIAFSSFDRLKEMERVNAFGTPILAPGNLADPESFKVRRGKVGGYRDYLTAEQAAQVEAMVAARLSPAYGYQPAPLPASEAASAAYGT